MSTDPSSTARGSAGSSGVERWAIVGGGLLGLTLAHRLREAGHDVTVFEAAPEVGGLASAWSIGDAVWDRHYHVTLASDRALLALIDELGLRERMRWGATRTACASGGKVYDVSGPAQFLRLPIVAPITRLRIGATLAWGTVRRDWQALERVPVETWLRRWSGDAGFERFWLPLLRAKLGTSWPQASAAFLWATIQRLAGARGKGLGGERFGYLSGGYHALLATFAARLASDGVEVRTGAAVQEIHRHPEGLLVEHIGGAEQVFDRVVLTGPGPAVAGLAPELSDAERARLRSIAYQGVVCVSVLMRRPLTGVYLTNIVDESLLTGVVEMTTLVDPAELGGNHLIYLPRYVAPDDPLLDTPDDEVIERFCAELARIYPGFDHTDVVATRVSKVRRVFAVPTLGYSGTVLPFTTTVPGLHVVHGAQIVNGTLNVNETVELAQRALPVLLAQPAVVHV